MCLQVDHLFLRNVCVCCSAALLQEHWAGEKKEGEGKKIEKRGELGEDLLMVPCSGFYVNLKSVFPLIRF